MDEVYKMLYKYQSEYTCNPLTPKLLSPLSLLMSSSYPEHKWAISCSLLLWKKTPLAITHSLTIFFPLAETSNMALIRRSNDVIIVTKKYVYNISPFFFSVFICGMCNSWFPYIVHKLIIVYFRTHYISIQSNMQW